MIFFCGTGDRGMPEPLFRVAQLWKEKKEQGRATLSLRVTLAMSIFSATLDRCREIHQKAEKIEQAKEQGMINAEGAWPYLLWDAGNQRHVLNPRREPSPEERSRASWSRFWRSFRSQESSTVFTPCAHSRRGRRPLSLP